MIEGPRHMGELEQLDTDLFLANPGTGSTIEPLQTGLPAKLVFPLISQIYSIFSVYNLIL